MTAPATPTVTVTALDDLEALLGAALNYTPGMAGYSHDPFVTRAESALAVTRALVEAALAWVGEDGARPERDELFRAARQYRNWHPTASGSGGDGGGGGEGEGTA